LLFLIILQAKKVVEIPKNMPVVHEDTLNVEQLVGFFCSVVFFILVSFKLKFSMPLRTPSSKSSTLLQLSTGALLTLSSCRSHPTRKFPALFLSSEFSSFFCFVFCVLCCSRLRFSNPHHPSDMIETMLSQLMYSNQCLIPRYPIFFSSFSSCSFHILIYSCFVVGERRQWVQRPHGPARRPRLCSCFPAR